MNSRAVVTATKLYEGQPTLLCEATALGIPSVFPETGGIVEFFPKNYALSFEQHNYDELSKILTDLEDIKNMKRIGEENKAFYLKNFNSDNYLNKMEKIFDER